MGLSPTLGITSAGTLEKFSPTDSAGRGERGSIAEAKTVRELVCSQRRARQQRRRRRSGRHGDLVPPAGSRFEGGREFVAAAARAVYKCSIPTLWGP